MVRVAGDPVGHPRTWCPAASASALAKSKPRRAERGKHQEEAADRAPAGTELPAKRLALCFPCPGALAFKHTALGSTDAEEGPGGQALCASRPSPGFCLCPSDLGT